MHGPSHGGSSSFSGGSPSFSGGSSSGGVNLGGGGASSGGFGPRRYRGPRPIIFFGRTYYCASGAASLAMFALVALCVAAMFLIFGANTLADSQTTISHMEADSIEWQQIIEHATDSELTHDEYYTFDVDVRFKEGRGTFADGYTFKGYSSEIKYDSNNQISEWVVLNYELTYEDLDYFQMFFVFTDELGRRVMGLTYAQFAENQIGNISRVKFAYKLTGTETLAINADYSLEKCMDYFAAKDTRKSATTQVVVTSIISAVLVAGIVVALVVGIKRGNKAYKLEQEKKQAEIDKTNAETDNIKADTDKKNRKCAYCGGDLPEDAVFCPGCGSRISK